MRIVLITCLVHVALLCDGLFAQERFSPCADSVDPLIGLLAQRAREADPELGYGYASFASGAALAAGWTSETGLHLPLRQKLLWTGNLFHLADSAYLAYQPRSLVDAEEVMLDAVAKDGHCLILTTDPVLVHAVDSSFGEPWFFVAFCTGTGVDTTIWDRADFRTHWWWWTDEPGANSIWFEPEVATPTLGRRAIVSAMRNLVLSARPDSSAGIWYGLSAVNMCRSSSGVPGDAQTLARMAALRGAAAGFLARQADLWAPSDREPIKLAAYYLRKDAEMWRTIAVAATDWSSFDVGQRDDWLAALADWETRAAVALDEIIVAQAQVE